MAVPGVDIEAVRLDHYLGSQQYEDEVLLAFHEAVARRLCARQEGVLAEARALLERWSGLDDFTQAEHSYMRRWKALLELGDAELIASAIVERSDEGRFLRQCSPFARSLSDDERLSIRRECEARVRSRLGPSGC